MTRTKPRTKSQPTATNEPLTPDEVTSPDERAVAQAPKFPALSDRNLPAITSGAEGKLSFGIADDLADLDLGIEDALTEDEDLEFADLQLIKMPKSDVWKLADGEIYDVLEGILLARTKMRAFWGPVIDDDGNIIPSNDDDRRPPDCSSLDALSGRPASIEIAERFGLTVRDNGTCDCRTCPMAQWGTATDDDGTPTRGQACRTNTMLLFAIENLRTPLVLRLPPTSSKPMREYCVSLQRDRGLPYWGVWTKLSLRVDGRGKREWTVIVPEFEERFDRDSIMTLKNVREAMSELINQSSQRVIADMQDAG